MGRCPGVLPARGDKLALGLELGERVKDCGRAGPFQGSSANFEHNLMKIRFNRHGFAALCGQVGAASLAQLKIADRYLPYF